MRKKVSNRFKAMFHCEKQKFGSVIKTPGKLYGTPKTPMFFKCGVVTVYICRYMNNHDVYFK